MNINYVTNNDNKRITRVTLTGRLDAQNAENIEEELLQLVNDGSFFFLIDMNEINYLGSCGIRIFLGLNNKLNKVSGQLKILNMPDTGIKILKAMEIIDRFDLYDNEEKALHSF